MEKLSMLKIKELFRLAIEMNLSHRQIAQSLNVSHTVVNRYLKRFKKSNLSYETLLKLGDKEIISALYEHDKKSHKRTIPDWDYIHKEMKRKAVTLELLHEEYVHANPLNHYGYTWFCTRYKEHSSRLTPSMRMSHKAGDKCFIDFSGMTFPVSDPLTGEVRNAEIFVGVLGASGYPFVLAVSSQKKADFIHAHVMMFKSFGGVPRLLVPDNLKSAVVKGGRYEGDINPDYERLAAHYGCAVMPARPLKPKDKPLVENGVKLTQRWILAKLRNHTFFSIAQLNDAINDLLVMYRNKVMKRYGVSRQELFDTIDKPELQRLPLKPYEHKELKLLKVGIDYHIILNYCLYSVPYQLVGEKVEVWYGTHTVTISHNGKVVANHPKLTRKGSFSTQSEHMSSAHQKYLEWSPGRILNWGLTIGKHTSELLKLIMEKRPHPEMGYRSCLGIMREFKKYSAKGVEEEKLDSIARYAINHHRFRLKQITDLLKEGIDERYDDSASFLPTLFETHHHANIRGSNYYR
ncbi:MAG: IS21 family transposase [Sulfurospirillum sp.]|jgi:transposase